MFIIFYLGKIEHLSFYPCLRVQLSGIECSHIVGRQTSLSISRTFSLSQIKTLIPLNDNSPFFPPSSPVTTILLYISISLSTLCTSYTRNHTIFVLCLWLISLSMGSSRFISVVPCVRISPLLRLNIPCMYISPLYIFCLSNYVLMNI